MATSIINEPFKDYVIVAESGSASDTIENKLGVLRTAFLNLSDRKKTKAFIRRNTSYYNMNSSNGTFCYNALVVSGGYYVVGMISLSSEKYVEFTFKTSGMTTEDLTSTTSSSNYELGYWL